MNIDNAKQREQALWRCSRYKEKQWRENALLSEVSHDLKKCNNTQLLQRVRLVVFTIAACLLKRLFDWKGRKWYLVRPCVLSEKRLFSGFPLIISSQFMYLLPPRPSGIMRGVSHMNVCQYRLLPVATLPVLVTVGPTKYDQNFSIVDS